MLTNLNAAHTNDAQFIENKIEELETKQTLSKKLKFSQSYINKLMRQRKIPFLKNGRCVRFRYSEVMTALKKESAV